MTTPSSPPGSRQNPSRSGLRLQDDELLTPETLSAGPARPGKPGDPMQVQLLGAGSTGVYLDDDRVPGSGVSEKRAGAGG